MPYRKYVKRRVTYKRRPYRSKRRFNYGKAAYRMLKKNTEVKYFTVNTNGTEINSDAELDLDMTAIAQGDTNTSREGIKITAKSLYIRGTLVQTGQDSVCRMVAFIDRQQVADSDPTISQVYGDGTIPPVYAASNLLYSGRFQILMDKMFALDASDKPNINLNYYIKLNKGKGVNVRYNGSTATDIQKNGIYVMFISNVTAANTGPLFYGQCRLGFTDI